MSSKAQSILAPSSRPRGPRRGFSLIEILVVTLILAIAAAIVVPSVGGNDSQNAHSAARQLMADLLYAQSRAQTTRAMQYVVFDSTSGQYSIEDSLSPAHVIASPVDGAVYTIHLGSTGIGAMASVSISSVNFDNQRIIAFDSMGVPYACASDGTASALISGSVVLTSGATSVTVSVSPYTGQITSH